MDGILILNKPTGYSSHDCVNIARRAFNTRKVGHSGTLDPEASGVLVLAINKATRILEFLNQDDKRYEFEVCFNMATDTLDHTGEVTEKNAGHAIDTDELDNALETFKGTYYQKPPAFAAVKVEGKKLYEYAREGKPIPDVPPRTLTVYDMKRLSEPTEKEGLVYVRFEVYASKGLYVRKLAEDLAKTLGTVAHTTMIHRTKAGKFTMEDSVTMEKLKVGSPSLMSLNEALSHIPEVVIDDSMKQDISHGKAITLNRREPLLRMVDESNALIAIYRKKEDMLYKPKKVFITGG